MVTTWEPFLSTSTQGQAATRLPTRHQRRMTRTCRNLGIQNPLTIQQSRATIPKEKLTLDEICEKKGIPTFSSSRVRQRQIEYQKEYCRTRAAAEYPPLAPVTVRPYISASLIFTFIPLGCTLMYALWGGYWAALISPAVVVATFLWFIMAREYRKATNLVTRRNEQREEQYRDLMFLTRWCTMSCIHRVDDVRTSLRPPADILKKAALLKAADPTITFAIDYFYTDPYIWAERGNEKVCFGHW